MVNPKSLSDEELKKKVLENRAKHKAEIKKGLNFTPLNPIDKFTNLDELVRENTLAQRENTIAQRELANITHKLLLAIYYKNGGEGSIAPNGIDTSAILEKITSGGDDYQTLVNNFVNVNVSGNETVFEIEESGILAECKFQSSTSTTDNKTYGVRIMSDKNIIYQDTWTGFEARNNYERDMTCWEDDDNNYYILQFVNIAFVKNLKIEIYESSASFTNIYVKYHKKV